MSRIIIIVVFLSTLVFSLRGQSFTYPPTFLQNDMIWNPARTAERDFVELGGYYRQQWLGYEGAPKTIMLHAGIPVPDLNFSIGGFVYQDRIGVTDLLKFGLSYVYQIQFNNRRKDQLSLGVSISGNQSRWHMKEVISRGNDPLLSALSNSGIEPNIDIGFSYMSDTRMSRSDSYYYFGASLTSLGKIIIPSQSNSYAINYYNSGVHGTLSGGYVKKVNKGVLSTNAWVSYSGLDNYLVSIQANYQWQNLLSLGLLATSRKALGIKAGFFLKNLSGNDGMLRIEMAALSNFSQQVIQSNPTFEVGLSYRLPKAGLIYGRNSFF